MLIVRMRIMIRTMMRITIMIRPMIRTMITVIIMMTRMIRTMITIMLMIMTTSLVNSQGVTVSRTLHSEPQQWKQSKSDRQQKK